jgi:hypothetical protein
MIRNRVLGVFAVCTLALALAPSQAQAQVKPFKIVGSGIGPEGLPLPGQDPRPHWAVGTATHLGRYYGQGEVQTDTVNFNADGTITGEFGSPVPFVFTGANGDDLACFYGNTDEGATNPGTYTLIPIPSLGPGIYVAVFVAEFVPYDPLCTGKFEGVSGSWIMYAVTAPFVLGSSDPVPYSWEGQGSLTFSKGH